MEQYGLELEWTDPNGSHEDDVRAYIDALFKLKDELLMLPEGCFDYLESDSARGIADR